MTRYKRLFTSPLATTACVTLLAVMPAALAWVHMRPRVAAVSDQGQGVYADAAAAQVFGSDVIFALIVASVALLALVVCLVVTRGRELSVADVVGGAVIQIAGAFAVLALGPAVDGIAVSPSAPFPPTRLAAGLTVLEPARIHASSVVVTAPLTWLLGLLVFAVVRPSREG